MRINGMNQQPNTPINVDRLHQLLQDHPDPVFVSYVINGLEHGFNIGYTASRKNIISPNLPSCSPQAHQEFISSTIHEACARGETAGPFDKQPFPVMHISGIGVVPKKSGKLRLIHHLSAPPQLSVNDGICKADFSLQYVTVDTAIANILHYGRGAYLSKIDIKAAFRICPVRREDWPLLAFKWKNQFYFDRVLPFGLRSSPAIFNSVAEAVEWVIKHHFSIESLLHYLDDYLNITGSSQSIAQHQLAIILDVFCYLGIPIADEKVAGPNQTMVFLGIVLDTLLLEARLPADKLAEIRLMLNNLLSSPSLTVGSLDQFLGKLSFASRVIVPGRTFTRRLWDLKSRHHHLKPFFRIKLPEDCRKDLLWWRQLLQDWNGRSFFLNTTATPADELGLFTDASNVGWGAYFSRGKRFVYGKWSAEEQSRSIQYRELYAIVAACSAWGEHWSRQRVVFNCDNQSVVDAVTAGTSRSPDVMCLLRSMFMLCAKNNFHASAVHVPGVTNVVADSLSRLRLQEFRRLVPEARAQADQVPAFPWEDDYLKTSASTPLSQ